MVSDKMRALHIKFFRQLPATADMIEGNFINYKFMISLSPSLKSNRCSCYVSTSDYKQLLMPEGMTLDKHLNLQKGSVNADKCK